MLGLPPGVPTLLVGAATTIAAAIIGIRRSRKSGKLDPFHPLVFPAIYVGVATLGPALWIWGTGDSLGYIGREFLSPRTPLLLTLGVAGFIIGAAIPLKKKVRQEANFNGTTMSRIGRVVLLVPLAFAVQDLRNNTC